MKIKQLRDLIADLDGELDVCVIDRDNLANSVMSSTQITPVDDDGVYGSDAKPGWPDVFLLEIN